MYLLHPTLHCWLYIMWKTIITEIVIYTSSNRKQHKLSANNMKKESHQSSKSIKSRIFKDHARIPVINQAPNLQQMILCSWWLIILPGIMSVLPWTMKTQLVCVWDLIDWWAPQFTSCPNYFLLKKMLFLGGRGKQIRNIPLLFSSFFLADVEVGLQMWR